MDSSPEFIAAEAGDVEAMSSLGVSYFKTSELTESMVRLTKTAEAADGRTRDRNRSGATSPRADPRRSQRSVRRGIPVRPPTS